MVTTLCVETWEQVQVLYTAFDKEKGGTAARLHAQWREDFPSSLEHLDYADEVRLPPNRFQAKREQIKRVLNLLPQSQGQHMALTVLYVPDFPTAAEGNELTSGKLTLRH